MNLSNYANFMPTLCQLMYDIGFIEKYGFDVGLNERQIRAVAYVRKEGWITNREYQKLFDVSKRTASSDLASLTKIGVLKKVGKGKRGLKYRLR